jgi:hypothetical protein
MTYALLSNARVVRIPDAWTVFTIDCRRCERRPTGEIVTFVGERWRAVDTNQIRIGQSLGEPRTRDAA